MTALSRDTVGPEAKPREKPQIGGILPVLPSRYLKVRERRRRNQQRNTRKGKRQREIQGTYGYFVTSVLCPGAALAFADHL